MSKDAVSQDKLMTEAIQKEERFEFKEFRPFQSHKTPKDIAANPTKVDPNAHFKKVAADILSTGTTLKEATVPEVRKERFGYETSSNAVGNDWKKGIAVQKEFDRYSKPRSTCEVSKYAANYYATFNKSPFAK